MKKIPGVLIISVLFLSCGIDEYYYLPQIPQNNITTSADTEANIIIPRDYDVNYLFFTNFAIYYKMYVGTEPYADINFNSDLRNDYNAISPYTNPANTSGGAIDNLFRTRNYNELYFENETNDSMMPKAGGTQQTLRIIFPTDPSEQAYARRNTNNEKISLCRSIIDFQPDRFFLNSPILRTHSLNTDVSKREGGEYVCVSLYIVAIGYDSNLFKPIFSKPTFIGNFKLNAS